MDPNSLADDLRREIEIGAIPAGAPLRQEDLGRRFGVSRQPVRQALDRLLTEGLLVRRSDRTLAVAALDERDAAEIASLRTLLESEALRQAFGRLDKTALKRARRIAEDLVDEDDPVRLEELDVAFHDVLYSGCENKRLLRLIEVLRRDGRRAYYAQPKRSINRARYVEEHERLLNACEQRDLPSALSVLAKHFIHSRLKGARS